jgi:methylated-DNA-protein-cysteine methyltransferase-like protein
LHDLPAVTAVPWQRVVKAGGWPAFPDGSEVYRQQRALLLQEGVEFRGRRIDLDRFGWRPALDELLFAMPPED